MIDDKEWEEFCKWCKTRWSMFTPNRASVESFLDWREKQLEKPPLRCKKEVKHEATSCKPT